MSTFPGFARGGHKRRFARPLSITHLIGVLILGFVVLFASRWIVPHAIYDWMTLVSGIAVAVVGARGLARFVATLRPRAHVHVHHHRGAHAHEHVHAHGIDADDTHARHHAVVATPFVSATVIAMIGALAH